MMGLDLCFYKTVKTDLRPVRDIESDDLGNILGHPELKEETLHPYDKIRNENLPVYPIPHDFHAWEKTFANKGLNFSDYSWIGYDSGHKFEKNATKERLLIPDNECVLEKRDIPCVIVKEIFYDRISYSKKVEQSDAEMVLGFDMSLIDVLDKVLNGSVHVSPQFFLSDVLPAIIENYSTEVAMRWAKAFKEHEGKFDLVLVSY